MLMLQTSTDMTSSKMADVSLHTTLVKTWRQRSPFRQAGSVKATKQRWRSSGNQLVQAGGLPYLRGGPRGHGERGFQLNRKAAAETGTKSSARGGGEGGERDKRR